MEEENIQVNKVEELSFFLKNIKTFIHQEIIDVCLLLFKKFSKDDNKTVPTKDLGTMLRLLDLNPSSKEVNEMIYNLKSSHEDQKESMTIEEFLICVARKRRDSDTIEELLSCFRYLDKEATGKIAEPTLRYYLCNVSDRLENEEMDALMKEAVQFTEVVNEVKYVKYHDFALYLKDMYKPPEIDSKTGKGSGKGKGDGKK